MVDNKIQKIRSNAYMKEYNKANKKKRASSGRNCVAVAPVKIPKTKVKPTTKELEEKVMQKFKLFNMSKKLIIVAIAMVIMVTSVFAYMETSGSRSALEVTFGEQSVGYIDSKKEFNQIFDETINELNINWNKDIIIKEEPTFIKKKIEEGQLMTEEDIKERIKAIALIEAYTITIDGEPIGVLKDESEAMAILENLKEPYMSEDPNISVNFAKDVRVIKEEVHLDKVKQREEVFNLLTALKDETKVYEITEKDTLWDIALDHQIKIEDIIRMNPGLTEEIKPGQKINLSVPEPVLAIETREKVVYNEEIPFEIEEIKDENLYQGTREVVEEGIKGEEKVEVEIVRLNGIETDTEIKNKVALSEPKTQVEKVGIKPRPAKHGTGSFIRPSYGSITSRFGSRWGSWHTGVDLAGKTGDPIYAADGGKVTFAGWQGSYGYLVKINHDNEYTTYYGHCSKLLVKAGERVTKGQQIAKVGSTGRSTGPHVHFEVRKNGEPQDPLNYLK